MGELLNSGLLNMASLMISLVVLLVGLVIWFFVNRASSRTNEQIELLEALLRRLCEANEPEEKDAPKDAVAEESKDEDDFIRLVAER